MVHNDTSKYVRIFALQLHFMLESITRYERLNHHNTGSFSIVRSDADGDHKYQVTPELMECLKYAAFARYCSLISMGSKDIADTIIEYHSRNSVTDDSYTLSLSRYGTSQ